MSTILKALRRLEDERDDAPERPLREEVAEAEGAARARRKGPVVAVVGVVAAAIVLISAGTYWLVTAESTETRATPEPAAQLAAATPTPRAERPNPPPVQRAPAVLGGPDPEERELSPAALQSSVAVVKREPPQPRIDDSPDMEVSVRDEAVEAEPGLPSFRSSPSGLPGRHTSRSAIPVGRLRNNTTPENALEPDEPPLRQIARAPAPRPVAPPPEPDAPSEKAVPSSTAPRQATPPPESVVRSAPQKQSEPESVTPLAKPDPTPVTEAKRKIETKQVASIVEVKASDVPAPVVKAPAKPAVKPVAKARPAPLASEGSSYRVDRTVWHPVATKRLAMVAFGDGEPLEVREGDDVRNAVVVEIEPSGVVFTKQGKEFRRRVGETQ